MAHTEHTPGKLILDGDFIIGGIADPEKYNGEEGIVIADYCPKTEYLHHPSEQQRRNDAVHIVTCWNEHDQLKAENEKVKRLLHDLTPGGSEFYNDPEYCAKWIRKEREECAALQRETIVELKRELQAYKEREAKLRAALQPLANLDLTGVTGPIVYQRDSTYIKVADVQKAKEALNQ